MLMKYLSLGLLGLLGAMVLSGCTDHSKPNVELIQDMMESPAVKAQDFSTMTSDGLAMREPPKGTIPRNFEIYRYGAADFEKAQAELVNPLQDKVTPEALERGRTLFTINCAVCHGPSGDGKGPISGKMVLAPPSLLSDKVRKFPDGRVFHIITRGQGLMGSYASSIRDFNDRWAVVSYVRNLQKIADTTASE